MRMTMARRIWGLLVCALFLATLVTAARAEASAQLISDELLEHAQLTRRWQMTLPVKDAEGIKTMTILGDRLYVRSGQNYTWSLDRTDGRVVFSQSIAPPGFPLLGWNAYGDRLISVIDNQLVEFDKDRGVRKRVSDLELSIVAPPVRNNRFFYVSAADRRLHVVRADDLVQVFEVAARNDPLITSVLADENVVIFGTDAGNVIAMTADAPRKLWQFNATKPLAGPVVRDGRSFYFANKDTHVYRVDEVGASTASLIWKYQTEAILDRPPHVTDAVVYQYALNRGLAAIDKRSGQTLWFLPEGIDLLAESRGKAYVITKPSTLAVMDNRAGRQLYWMNLAQVVHHAANAVDAMIYLADDQGRIVCLEPAR